MTGWDERYLGERHERLRPHSKSLAELLPGEGEGRALDIACGDGRNAIYLAGLGYEVTAIDSSTVAIEKARSFAKESGVKVDFVCADLESYHIHESSYDLIICFYYLQRSLMEAIKRGLKKNGSLLYETYTLEQRELGRPKNSDFLLAHNELLSIFGDMHVDYYREGIISEDGEKKAVATISCVNV